MKVHIQSRELCRALRLCAPFVTNSQRADLLSHVRLRAEDGTITMMANDFAAMVEVTVQGGIERPGACTFPLAGIAPVLDRLPWGNVAIGATDGVVEVAAGHYQCAFLDSCPEAFPSALAQAPLMGGASRPVDDAETTFSTGSGHLKVMFDAVHRFMGDEPTRYYLQGVYLHQVGGKLRAVATNGHRLAFIDSELFEGLSGMGDWIIPRPVVAYFLANISGQITVQKRGDTIRILNPAQRIALTAKLIEYDFPNYAAVIPEEGPLEERGRLVVGGPLEFSQMLADVMGGDDDSMRGVVFDQDDAGLLLRIDGQAGVVTNCTLRIPPHVAVWEGAPPPSHAYYQMRYLRGLFEAAWHSPGRCTFQPGAAPASPALLRRGRVTAVLMGMLRRDG